MSHNTTEMDIENGSFQPIDIEIKFEKPPEPLTSDHTYWHLYKKYGCIQAAGWIHPIDIFRMYLSLLLLNKELHLDLQRSTVTCVKGGNLLTFNHNQSVWFNIRDVTSAADPARYTET